MCTRCVRFTREISGTAELQVINRGTHAEIDIFPGEPCNNKLAGNVVDLCPVGALCSKDFLYKQRVWWLKTPKSVCPNCSTGCSINVDQNDDRVYRLRPRPNPQAQGHFMCDEGRFGWKYIHSDERLTLPEQRQRRQSRVARLGRHSAGAAQTRCEARRRSSEEGIAAVLLAVDDGRRSVPAGELSEVAVAEGRAGAGPGAQSSARTTSIPRTCTAEPIEPAKFTIRAEKCPNRRGVEAMLQHFAGDVAADGRRAGPRGRRAISTAVYLVGGDPAGLDHRRSRRRRWTNVDTVIVQDILPSPASRAGDVRAARRLVRRARRHVRESRRPGAGDSPVDPLARRSASRTAASCGTWPADAACSTRRRCGKKWARRFESLRRWQSASWASTACDLSLERHQAGAVSAVVPTPMPSTEDSYSR